ncbi:MAG: bifunctional heptose 7-phosphate kinase/heptose 1-phosphate adenyltransferase [Anaerolineae bacterium]
MHHQDQTREGRVPMLSRTRLQEILKAIRNVRIGIVGDFTLDGYWYVDMVRAQLSREAPLYNRPVVRETYSAGGCANVAVNVAALQPREAWAFTVLGEDWRGLLLRQVLSAAGLRLEATLTCATNWVTPFYGKVILMGYDTQQEDARVDFINTYPLPDTTLDAMLEQITSLLPTLDAIIIADYQPVGVVPERMVRALNQMAEAHPQVIFAADSRTNIAQFQGMVIKPNSVEATQMWFPGRRPDEVTEQQLTEAGLRAQANTGRPVYITCGERGALLCAAEGYAHIPAMPVAPPIDTVGAGDTFLAALTTALAAGATPWEAGWLASLAAAVTIRKLHTTGTATPEEIMAVYDTYVPGLSR